MVSPLEPGSVPGHAVELPTLADSVTVAVGSDARLATDVHLPDVVGSGVPTLLLRTPYGRDGDIDRVPELAEAAAAAGMALVAQDVRGRHGSSGETLPFAHEEADGAATLDWIGSQQWSNGEVVPVGDSYSGFTACAAAASPSAAAVVGVVARVTSLRPLDDWLHRADVFRLDLALPWLGFAFGPAPSGLERPAWDDPATVSVLAESLPEGLRERVLGATAGDAWDRATRVDPLRIDAPILHWTGWWDCLGHGQWDAARRRLTTSVGHRDGLIVGPTDHEFHAWSRAADTDEQAALVVENCDRVRHQARSGGPLPRAATPARAGRGDAHPRRSAGVLYLRDAGRALLGPEGGSLSPRPDALASSVAWIHDPQRPVPSLDGWVWGPLHAGLADETSAQVRDDVITFTTGELRQEELMAGRVRLTVRGGSDHRWHLVVAMTDVARDGSATRVSDGVGVVPGATGWQEVEVDLGTVAYHLRAGHRLRLSLAASAYPRYPASPVAGEAWWREPPTDAHEVRIQVGPHARLMIEPDRLLDTLLAAGVSR